ncbi:MAG: HAMP domain-containing sensor histidine kinase [Mycobacterium sp.]|jgi:signal transduction histidine kinase
MVPRLRLLSTRRVGVRATAAATAATVVALTLVAAGVAQVVLLDYSLRSAAEATVLEQTEQVAARLAPDGPAEALRELHSTLDLVQVLDAGGAVAGASAPLVGQAPLSSARPVPGEVVTEEIVSPAIDPDDTLIVAVRGIMTPDGPRTVLAAVTLNGVDNSVRTAERLLWLGVPALVSVTALATFAATGRALRPVEAIRTRVAAMSDRDLDQRVPVPATRDEIGRLATTMNALLARLQGAQRVQRQFVADASHELRSPLATITAGLDLVDSRNDRDAARLTAMREEAQRLDRIIGDLLLLARADERGLLPRSVDVDLDELVYTEQLRLREIGRLQIDVDVIAVRIRGDGSQLARMLRNLVDNAVRHSSGRIAIRLRPEAGGAILEVADDGPGVPVADRDRIFTRFVRLDAARDRTAGGTGLGLAIVAEVVGAHGGRVEVLDHPGGGALFRVRLPAQPPSSTPSASMR